MPVFEKYNRSAVKLSAILDGIVSTVESYGDPNQQMLDGLGSMIPTAQGIIASSIRNTEQAMADRAAGIAPGQMRFDAETVQTEAAEDAERWLAMNHPEAEGAERERLREQFTDRYVQKQAQLYAERFAAVDMEWRAQNEQRSRNYAKQLEAKFPGLKVIFTDLGGPNSMYKDGKVYIDVQRAGQTDIFNRVLFHELTHHIEATGQYQQFQDLMLSMAFHTTYGQLLENMKAGTMTQADQELLASIQSKMYQYNNSGIADAHLDQDGAVQEIVADLTYKMFNGDQQAINDFVRAEPNLAQRILEKIKEFIQTLTGNTQEPNEMQKRLQKAQGLFEQALRSREVIEEKDNGIQFALKGKRSKGHLLTSDEYSEFHDVLLEGKRNQKAKPEMNRPGGGYFVSNRDILVYADKYGNPEHVLEIYGENEFIKDDIHDTAIELEREGNDYEMQRILLESMYGEERAHFRDEGNSDANQGSVARGTGFDQRRMGPENRGRISTEEAEGRAAGEARTDRGSDTGDNEISYSLPATDNQYLQAIENNDLDTAQQLVDRAAKDAGYNLHVYHGTGAQFNEFSYDFLGKNGSAEGQGFYFTDSKEMASGYASGEQGQVLDGYLRMEKTLSDSEKTLTRKQLRDILKAVDPTCEDVCINYEQTGGAGYPGAAWKARALNDAVSAIFEGNDTDSDILAEIANSGAGTEEVTKAARQLGFDGYKVEGKYPGATVYVAFESDQFKRGDAVTYDDAGNVIPLSQRFNPESKDIRYSLPTDQHQSSQTALPIDSQLQQEIDAAVERALAEREAKRAQNLEADERRSAEEAMRRVETYEKRKGLKLPNAESMATRLFDDTLPLFKITERLMDQQKQRIEELQQKQRNGETLTDEEIIQRKTREVLYFLGFCFG